MTKKKKAGASGKSKRGGKASSTTSASSSSSNSSASSVGKPKEPPRSKRSKSDATSSKNRSNKKQRSARAEPPFPLFQDVKKADISEGLDSVVNLLRGRKNIVVLAGAGISVSCGLPDFRSKGTGLYSTLNHQDLGLSCPEELFDWEIFKEDPRPFYKFARNLYFPFGSGDDAERVRPSDSHKLLALLEQKKMLLRVYSQNIDGLEETAGVSIKKMVYAHGSLQYATCCKCNNRVTAKEIEPAILNRTVPLCEVPTRGTSIHRKRNPVPVVAPLMNPSRAKKRPRTMLDMDYAFDAQEAGKPDACNGVLKPGVTFFGEALNDTVRKSLEADRSKVDALIVIGTSLSVAPMSKVIGWLPPNVPRILINRNIVHPKTGKAEEEDGDDEEKDFREGYMFDAYLLGFCDDVTRTLARKLFSTEADLAPEVEKKRPHCQLLATVRKLDRAQEEDVEQEEGNDAGDDDYSVELVGHKAADWEFCKIPSSRVLLFPGAEPTRGSQYGDDGDEDNNSEVTFREIAHCDGCQARIEGTIQKCVECFDYDLCKKCFPKLSKTHYGGKHNFAAESGVPVEG